MRPDPAAPGWTHRMSLRARLLAVAVGLLVVAVALTGVATLTALRNVLVGQVDTQLATVAANPRDLGDLLTQPGRGPGSEALPSDYVVRLSGADGTVVATVGSALRDTTDVPRFGDLSMAQVTARDGRPFTVGTQGGPGRWRVVAVPVQVAGHPGTVAVARPLDGVDTAVRQLGARLALIGLAVVAAGAGLGWLAVRRAFRPLRDVEDVATAFGAGDTSRRVADAWPGTEVGRLGSSVNAMLERIETTLASREASESRMRRFVADASHELRTPLAAVRGFAELYRQGAVRGEEEVARTFGRIEGEAQRMGGLVEDLLLLARLDEQRPLRFEDVDLVVLAADAVHDAHALAPDREVRLTGLDAAASPGAAGVRGDDARLRQVLSNLVANAVRHTPAGSPIELQTGCRGAWAVVSVVDHGPGISAADAEHVFERFYRGDPSRNRGSGGSGLGLAIVAAIAAAHSGAARVVPTPGGGATFEVALPAAAPPQPPQGSRPQWS